MSVKPNTFKMRSAEFWQIWPVEITSLGSEETGIDQGERIRSVVTRNCVQPYARICWVDRGNDSQSTLFLSLYVLWVHN